ncbi:MAG: ribosomal protein S18-alanine N-acetyltransferase [Thermodesulfovibrionales bacterium]
MINNTDITEIVISRMVDDDIPEVHAIEMSSFTMPWSEALFLNEVRNQLSRPMVARHSGRIAGYLCASLVIDEGHILDVAVHPSRRRQGIGRRLIDETLVNLIQQGCRTVFLEVRASHAGVIRFYEQAGFRVIQIRKCYYVSPIDDAAIMELRFPDPGHQ